MRIWISTAIFLLTLTMAIEIGSLAAQQRSPDSASQRILPLPEGNLSNSQTQMLLLKRLRSLVTAADDAENKSQSAPVKSSTIDDKQLEQLQQALKKLQDQLPPGMKTPQLDSIPKDQLDEAMANPAVQQQLKKMLEQFSKDGLLPRNENTTDNLPVPPIPGARRRSDNPSEAKPEPQADRPANPKPAEPRQPPAEKSWQSLQDAMKKLSDIAQSGEKTSRNSANGANSKVLPESVEDPVGRPVPDPQIDGKKVPRDQSQQADSGNEAGQGSLQAFQDLLERFQNSQRNQSANTDDENTAMQDDVTPPQIQPGMRPPVTRNVPAPQSKNRSSQVLRRPDRTAPNEPPVSPDQRMTEQGELTPPNLFPLRIPPTSPTFPPPTSQPKSTLSQSGNQGRTTPPIDQRTGRPSGTSAASSSESESFLSVSEFLKEQLQNGIPIPNGDETSRNHGVRSGEVRPDAMPRSDVARSKLGSTELSNQATQPEKSNIDVRKELEQSGLRRTLEKIVQKAKEESNAQQRAQQESVAGHRGSTSSGAANKATPNGPQVQPNSSVDPSMQKSLTDLLGGLDDNMQDIVKDAKFRDRPSNRQQARDSAWQQSPRESESRLSKWNDAASGFLSDLSKAPQAPTRSLSPAGGNSAITSDAPLAIGSVFLVGSFLLGLAAVVAYFMRRPLLKLVANATGIAGPNRVQQPGEIRSRADVIAAFHNLALSPKQLVESWWTHRAAAQKLAAESPQSKAAVDTLAEVYEQARYLPDDIELPPDSIQSARTAFAACR